MTYEPPERPAFRLWEGRSKKSVESKFRKLKTKLREQGLTRPRPPKPEPELVTALPEGFRKLRSVSE